MIEAWGRGIERIFEACRAAGTPTPEVGCEPSGVWLVFPFPESYQQALASATPVEMSVKTRVEMSVKTSVEMSVKTPVKASSRKPLKLRVRTPDRIVELLRANPQMSLAEVSTAIGKSTRTAERWTSRLVAAGRLRFVGPQKGGVWEVLE